VAAGRHDEDLARCWPDASRSNPLARAICSAPRHRGRASLKTGVLKSLRTPLSAPPARQDRRDEASGGGFDGGAESCAIVASVIHTAKLNEIEPLAHRRDVLKRIVSTRTKASELRSILHMRRRIRGRFY